MMALCELNESIKAPQHRIRSADPGTDVVEGTDKQVSIKGKNRDKTKSQNEQEGAKTQVPNSVVLTEVLDWCKMPALVRW